MTTRAAVLRCDVLSSTSSGLAGLTFHLTDQLSITVPVLRTSAFQNLHKFTPTTTSQLWADQSLSPRHSIYRLSTTLLDNYFSAPSRKGLILHQISSSNEEERRKPPQASRIAHERHKRKHIQFPPIWQPLNWRFLRPSIPLSWTSNVGRLTRRVFLGRSVKARWRRA